MARTPQAVGKVQTVTGLIEPEEVGIAMMHEHLLMDLTKGFFEEPESAVDKFMAHQPVRLENLYWMRTHWVNNIDNMQLMDVRCAIEEARLYKWAGGETIVEVSSIGLSRDPAGLVNIARATGLNIVMGCGYYVATSHPPGVSSMSEDELARSIARDITVGAGDTGIKAGIIGEIGCSQPLHENERKVLRAAAIAQQYTGAPLSVHPGPKEENVLEILDILRDAGADLSHTIMCHCDIFGFDDATLDKVAAAGCYLEIDNFGQPAGVFFQLQERLIETPSDAQRIDRVIDLAGRRHLDRILISCDHCYKYNWVAFGGYGYAHIVRDIVPAMRMKGVSDAQINTILVKNPARALTFAPPAKRL